MGSTTLEQFSPDGRHVATVASQGGGPGEISGWYTLADAGMDTLILENQGERRDLFYPDEGGVYRYARNMAGDSGSFEGFSITGVRSDTEFYAKRRRVIRNPMEMMNNPRDYNESYIHIIDRFNKAVTDSIQRLTTPEIHMQSVNGGFQLAEIPFRNHDRFVQIPGGGYLVARPAEHAIYLFDENHNELSAIRLNIEEREVTSADLDHHLENLSSELRRNIVPRVYDKKPSFLNLWASENHIWFQTDRTAEGREMVASDHNGELLGRFLLDDVDDVRKVDGNRIYAIHRNPDMGHSVRVYEVDL